jgi:hypothetical protein
MGITKKKTGKHTAAFFIAALIAFCGLVFIPKVVFGITFDSAASSTGYQAAGDYSYSQTVTSTTDTILIFYTFDNNVANTIAYNGTNATFLGSWASDGAVAISYIINPSSGTHNISWHNVGGAFGGGILLAASYSGVYLAAPFTNSTTINNGSGSTTISLDLMAGDTIIGMTRYAGCNNNCDIEFIPNNIFDFKRISANNAGFGIFDILGTSTITGTNSYDESARYGLALFLQLKTAAAPSPTPNDVFPLVVPSNGSTMPAANWNWIVYAPNISSGTTGYFGIEYGVNSSTPQFIDTLPVVAGASPHRFGKDLIVPRSQTNNLAYISTSTWYAKPYFYDSSATVFYYGSQIAFNINAALISIPSSTASSSRIVLASPPSGITPIITPGAACYVDPQTGDTDTSSIRFYACIAGDALFAPSEASKAYMGQSIGKYKQVFPFNVAYGMLGLLADETQAAATWRDNYRLDLPIYGMTIPILNSSTLSNFVGSANKTFIFTVETALAWVGVGWWILLIVF